VNAVLFWKVGKHFTGLNLNLWWSKGGILAFSLASERNHQNSSQDKYNLILNDNVRYDH
jgi:hypothetical protein